MITDAIRDEKVLKFKVDYNDVRAKFKEIESETDETKLSNLENSKEAFLHPQRIKEISEYILDNFAQKTHRLTFGAKGFNAMFAVSSVGAAKLYYESLNELQKDTPQKLSIATIFSYAQNENQDAIGEISDESFEPTALNSTAKEFLKKAIDDYNTKFGTSFDVDGKSFQNYYRDLSKRVKGGEVDLLIVVGMFLTGFDAPRLNTLFVDKNLRYHGLIQAYSRTNRIYDSTKAFGNIVTFRDLEKATIDAITLFGDENTKNIILEKSFREYLDGFEAKRGFVEVAKELQERFSEPENIEKESEKKEFVKLFGEYLKLENILQNFDEFVALKELKKVDLSSDEEVEEFKVKHYLDDESFEMLSEVVEVLPTDRTLQDYKSTYNDIREWIRRQRDGKKNDSGIDWNDVVFEVELLKSQEINLDFILELIYKNRKNSKDELIDEVKRLIRSSLENRAKEELLVSFINEADIKKFEDSSEVIEAFFKFAKKRMSKEANRLIEEENLNSQKAKRYISLSLKRGYASDSGADLNELLPKMSPLNPKYLTKKRVVFEKVADFVTKFNGIGIEV